MKTINGKTIYSVTEVNRLARQLLERISLWIEGEVSSLSGQNSNFRYLYFDLKDPQTGYKLPCILEPEVFSKAGFNVEDGKKVLVLGNLTLFEKGGRYQLYIHTLENFGEGLLLLQFEMRKRALEKKGYFELSKKKRLPQFPVNIAVITSAQSDAWQDFKKHSIESFPFLRVSLYDINVQGENSARQIVNALKDADQKNFEVIVLIRGGGSPEDLESFNSEKVADAIHKTKTCVLVGVGHEKDVTIAQLTADIAASTPTDAAKIITGGYLNLIEKLDKNYSFLKNLIYQKLSFFDQDLDFKMQKFNIQKQRLEEISGKLNNFYYRLNLNKKSLIFENERKLDSIYQTIIRQNKVYFINIKSRLKNNFGKLKLLSPRSTLSRGYSITRNQSGAVVKSSKSIAVGSNIKVQLAKGLLFSRVQNKK